MVNENEPRAQGSLTASPGPMSAGGSVPVLNLAYKGTGGDLFVLILKNVFLTLITLGIYAAWARTARRRFIWRQMDVGGQPLEYTGTGKELFFGYLKVGGAYLVLFLLPGALARIAPRVGGIVQGILVLFAVFFLVPYAVYWSRRFLLGRTRWRGIRFGLSGEAKPFAMLWLKGTLLTMVTLGIYGPIFGNRIYGMIMRNTTYGSATFSYDGSDREAFRIGLRGFLLSLVTLGIYSFWYRAEMLRFRMSHTHFDRATVRCDVTGGLLLKLTLQNMGLTLITLGIAFPWLLSYTLREVVSRLSVVGPIDFAAIHQQASSGDAAGDSLASALGVELGI